MSIYVVSRSSGFHLGVMGILRCTCSAGRVSAHAWVITMRCMGSRAARAASSSQDQLMLAWEDFALALTDGRDRQASSTLASVQSGYHI